MTAKEWRAVRHGQGNQDYRPSQYLRERRWQPVGGGLGLVLGLIACSIAELSCLLWFDRREARMMSKEPER
jgi:hypothetical protein